MSDLKVRDVLTVNEVKEVKTQFGTKVLNHLQIFFLEKEPNQLKLFKAQAEKSDLIVDYLGNREFKFIVSRNNPYYEDLKQLWVFWL